MKRLYIEDRRRTAHENVRGEREKEHNLKADPCTKSYEMEEYKTTR